MATTQEEIHLKDAAIAELVSKRTVYQRILNCGTNDGQISEELIRDEIRSINFEISAIQDERDKLSTLHAENQPAYKVECNLRQLFKLLPGELWFECIQKLSLPELLKVRLVCTMLNSYAKNKVYKCYYLKLFKGAVESRHLPALIRIFKYFDTTHSCHRRNAVQIYMLTSIQYSAGVERFLTASQMAASKGYFKVAEQLLIWIKALKVDGGQNYALMLAAMHGRIKIVALILEIYYLDEGDSVVLQVFYWGSVSGHLSIVKYIYQNYPSLRKSMIKYNHFRPSWPSTDAFIRGHLDIVQQIHWWCDTAERKQMIESLRVCFPIAASRGKLNVIKQLFEWSSADEIAAMIRAYDYVGFTMARNNHRLEVTRFLYSVCRDDEKPLMLKGNPNILNCWLSRRGSDEEIG